MWNLFNHILKLSNYNYSSIYTTIPQLLCKAPEEQFLRHKQGSKFLKNNNTKHDQYHGIKKTESHDSPNMNTIRKFSSLGCSLRGEEYFYINYFPYIFLIKKRIRRMV